MSSHPSLSNHQFKNWFIIWLRGITLIEVLISIAIFSIGILSISYLIIANIGLSERTKLKTTATMLAKEGMEIAYNRRDTNIKKGWLWNCLALKPGSYAGECQTFFHNPTSLNSSTKWIINIFPDKGYVFEAVGNLSNTKLYSRPSGKWYSLYTTFSSFGIVGTNSQTPFTRIITFAPVDLAPDGWPKHADKILKVTSTVTYKKGGYSGSVSLQSFMGDTLDTIPLDYYGN